MKEIAILSLLLFSNCPAFSQFVSARNLSMGNVSSCQADVFSSIQNIAKLSANEKAAVGLSVKNSFLIKELQRSSIAIKTPLFSGGFGIRYYRYGYRYYNENQFEIAYAHNLGDSFSMGLRFNWLLIKFGEKQRKEQSIYPSIGINYSVNEKLQIGFILSNLSLNKIGNYSPSSYSSYFLIGLAYLLNSRFRLHFESTLFLEKEPGVSMGLEYQIGERFFLRTGVNSIDSTISFGFGFKFQKWEADLASSFHNSLGLSPAISLRYAANN